MSRSLFLRNQKVAKSNNDGGSKLPPSLCAAEIRVVPGNKSCPRNGLVVDPAFPLRRGPHVILPMNPEYNALVSHASTRCDESVSC